MSWKPTKRTFLNKLQSLLVLSATACETLSGVELANVRLAAMKWLPLIVVLVLPVVPTVPPEPLGELELRLNVSTVSAGFSVVPSSVK